ncbi:MAG: glycosyltransferase family 39 protein [Deltaproteobacteria bacterium]|nr:glycosyltransferase family 39 protein [Deltaproteobacteria bacterium]
MAAPRGLPLLSRIAASPAQAFAGFVALHAAVWTALPALLYPNLPLDLIEALVYGREWQLGYDKLPPLPWWLVEIAYRLVGHDVAYYLLAQLAVVAAFAGVFAMARPLAGTLGALVAVLILDGLHYVNFTAVKFNHDVVQLPFWALAGFAFHRALRDGEIRHWLLLGLAIGLSLWAKYFVAMLALPLGLFVLIDRDARKCLTTPGPYVAVAAALVVMAPHLVWLVQNDFLPFAYAEHRALPSRGWYDHVWHPLQFTISQLFFLIPSLLIAVPLFYPRRSASEPPVASLADAFDLRIVTLLAFGPMACVLALSAVSGRGTVAMWGYPLWLFLGLWLVLTARRALDAKRLARVTLTWAIIFVGLAAGFIASYAVLPRYDHRYRAVFFPGADLGRELSQRYRAVTGKPIVYVIGSMWDAGNVAHYAAEHPRVLIDGKPERAPWIDLNDLKARGALVLWTEGDLKVIPPAYRTVAGDAAVQPPFLLHDRRGDSSRNIGWAILLPRRSYAQATSAVGGKADSVRICRDVR